MHHVYDNLTVISSGTGTMGYLYDGLGRRIYRQDASGIGHTFFYDGSNLVGEYNDNTSAWDTEYTYGYSLVDKRGAGGTEFALYNGLGDTYQTLNSSGGYVLSTHKISLSIFIERLILCAPITA